MFGWLLERIFDALSIAVHAGDRRRRAAANSVARRKAWEEASDASSGCECSLHHRGVAGGTGGVRGLVVGKIR